jgi:hypothetical protein
MQIINPAETFGDIIVDYSYVECTSACITALTAFQQQYPTHRCGRRRREPQPGCRRCWARRPAAQRQALRAEAGPRLPAPCACPPPTHPSKSTHPPSLPYLESLRTALRARAGPITQRRPAVLLLLLLLLPHYPPSPLHTHTHPCALRPPAVPFAHHRCRRADISACLRRAEQFVRSIQRPDGSWYGSWAVCFTYGTWFGTCALAARGWVGRVGGGGRWAGRKGPRSWRTAAPARFEPGAGYWEAGRLLEGAWPASGAGAPAGMPAGLP